MHMAVYGEGWLTNLFENSSHIVGYIFQLFVMNQISQPKWPKCPGLKLAQRLPKMGYKGLNLVVMKAIRQHLRNVLPIAGFTSAEGVVAHLSLLLT